jgi:phosphoenolpyruvate carboxykinase (ATP)
MIQESIKKQMKFINLSIPKLVEEAVKRNEGVLSKNGPIVINTAPHTGRSPKDRFIVKDSVSENTIAWGDINKPFDENKFLALKAKVLKYLEGKDLFIKDCYVGADKRYRISVRTTSEKAVGALFAHTMFIPSKDKEFTPEFNILHAPNFKADPSSDGTNSGSFVIISFKDKTVLIGGTHYSGEVKKSMFSIMNFLLPQRGIMTMHSSANYGKTKDDVAVFFGLSGTGKTTLSADIERTLIGDDEHGWSDDGVFNFEGGCYAKAIKLKIETEPEIYVASNKFGALLENVVIDPETREVNFDDASITENTRASYPVSYIPNMTTDGYGHHPKNIIMLTCDAFGVLPPVSKLSYEEAMDHFICGYTAKVAGTEEGIKEPQATSSPCFGAPFMPLSVSTYAKLLGEKIKKHNVDVWLVNTGWSGGPYGIGNRMKLSITRAIITAALDGTLKSIETKKESNFGLSIPVSCPGVPSEILIPRNTWKDKDAYDKKAKELHELFRTHCQIG